MKLFNKIIFLVNLLNVLLVSGMALYYAHNLDECQ